MARRETFSDPELQRRFEDEGYVTFQLLGEAERRALDDLASNVEVPEAFHASATSGETEERQRLSSAIREICAEPLEAVFDRHRLVFGSLLIKASEDPAGTVPPHLDWTTVDEAEFVGCTVWMPLADTTLEGGALCVLPRSHRLVQTPRGTPFIPTPFDSLAPEQIMRHGQPVLLRAGEAIAWDQRVVHWSPPNTTSRRRIAFGLGVVPAEAQLRHFFMTQGGVVQEYEVADDFYATLSIGEPPAGEPIRGVQVSPTLVDEATVRQVCGDGASAEEAEEDELPRVRVSTVERALAQISRRVPSVIKRQVPPAAVDRLRQIASRG